MLCQQFRFVSKGESTWYIYWYRLRASFLSIHLVDKKAGNTDDFDFDSRIGNVTEIDTDHEWYFGRGDWKYLELLGKFEISWKIQVPSLLQWLRAEERESRQTWARVNTAGWTRTHARTHACTNLSLI